MEKIKTYCYKAMAYDNYSQDEGETIFFATKGEPEIFFIFFCRRGISVPAAKIKQDIFSDIFPYRSARFARPLRESPVQSAFLRRRHPQGQDR